MQGCTVIYMNTTTDTQTITLYATSTTGYASMFTGVVNGQEASFAVSGDAFTSYPSTVAANLAHALKVDVADVKVERTASICGGKGCVKATIIRN